MSEAENLQLMEQMIAAVNSRSLDRYSQCVDAAFVQESELAPGPVRGPQGARQMLHMLLSAFPDLRIEVEQMLASGNYVVVRAHLTGTHNGSYLGVAPTHESISWRGCNVVEIRNGKAIRSRIYADNASLLEQIGAISIPRVTMAT